jgi:superfamily II RNA helicase
MAFTVQDYHDLTRLLWEHPEWREELRRMLLSDELLALPDAVRQLIEAHQRAEERLSQMEMAVQRLIESQQRLTERVDKLTEGQQRLTERVDELTEGQQRLTERVDKLTEGQQRLTEGQQRLIERVGELTEGQQRLTERVDELTEGQQRLTEGQQRLTEGQQRLTEGQQHLTDIVGGLKGQSLEITYRNKIFGFFGTLLRRMKVIEPHTLEDEFDVALTPDEIRDVLLIDLLVTGKLCHVPGLPDILLALEISSAVDRADVLRAVRRASLLRKVGYRVVPVVAGESVTQGVEAAVREQNVVLLQDGQVSFWKEALASWEGIQLAED